MNIIFNLHKVIIILQAVVLTLLVAGSNLIWASPTFLMFCVTLQYLYQIFDSKIQSLISYYSEILYESARTDIISHVMSEELKKDIDINEQSVQTLIALDKSKPTIDKICVYVRNTLFDLSFSDGEISIVETNLRYLAAGKSLINQIQNPIRYSSRVSQQDLKHLVWNVSKVLEIDGQKAASFAHIVFSEWFCRSSIDTTRRTLRESRAGCDRIPLFDKDTIHMIQGK